jgi:hypothetical protein
MRWNRSLPAVASAFALLGCSSGAHSGAAGTSTAPLEAERTLASDVRSLLSAYEAVPNRDAWLKLGPETPAVLEQIANDPGELPSRRARAAEVLGWFGEQGVPFLRRASTEGSFPAPLRAGAVTGLARALPAADAVPLLARTLNDEDASVRFRTVLELKALATPEARAALEARSRVETDGSVNRVLKQALGPVAPTVPGTPAVVP